MATDGAPGGPRSRTSSGFRWSAGLNAASCAYGSVALAAAGFHVLYVVALVWVAAVVVTVVVDLALCASPARRRDGRGTVAAGLLAALAYLVVGAVALSIWMSEHPDAQLSWPGPRSTAPATWW